MFDAFFMEITVDVLKANGVQFGHKTRRWNPKMKRYLYGDVGGIHIFNLEKTAVQLAKLVDFLKS